MAGRRGSGEKERAMDLGFGHGKYSGEKWGGKYLRAPDIFFTILEKGKGKLVRLGDIAEVRRGFTTGANDFFYLDPTGKPAPKGLVQVKNGAGWEGLLEGEFLKPVVKSPREIKSISICQENLRYKVFMCHQSQKALKQKGKAHALDYIRWGEAQGYNKRPTCNSRERWWDLGIREAAQVNCNYLIDDRMYFYFVDGAVYVSDDFQELHSANKIIAALISIPFTQIFCELQGRTPFGGGLLKVQTYEVAELLMVAPASLTSSQQQRLEEAFNQMAKREVRSIFKELGFPKPNKEYSNIHSEEISLDKVLPDRRELDQVVFEVLGLTEEEQLEVYRAVVNLVKNRLSKARNV